MEKLLPKEQQDLLNHVTGEAAKMLFMAFKLCDLKTHIHLTCDFGHQRFKMTFEPEEPIIISDCEHPKDKVVGWHDSSMLCTNCNSIIEQYGEKIYPPCQL